MRLINMIETEVEKLTSREQILVAIAVLLDGFDAEDFLAINSENGEALRLAAHILNMREPLDRLPHVATILRKAKKDFLMIKE